MDFPILAVALLGLLAALVDFIPVVNVVTDVVGMAVGSAEPAAWAFGAKLVESVVVLQLLMPAFEGLTQRTANTWDDGLLAKFAMILAFFVEITAALGAADPQIGSRIKAITGPRRTHR